MNYERHSPSMRTLIDVAMAKPTRTTEGLETLVGRVREAVDQSEAIIDGLLTLARSDRGLTLRELVDLEAAALDAIDQTSAAARESEITVEANLSPAPIPGDRVLIERLVANLVDNAIRYNFEGGSIHVETGTADGQSYLSVTNSGPLVQESKLPSPVRAVHSSRATSHQRPGRRARTVDRRLGRGRARRPPRSRRAPERRVEDHRSIRFGRRNAVRRTQSLTAAAITDRCCSSGHRSVAMTGTPSARRRTAASSDRCW